MNKDDVARIVQNCPKQRFHMQTLVSDESAHLSDIYIRANQGHTLTDVQIDFTEIKNPSEFPNCIHGW